ncbi:hypothetical protein [Amycolatopsis sp. CA-128772]|uniref:hypothetical protein n=1 Tax=Amycolatopsis sp. CA-128772 TaxID=2073159 RepID=UPI0011B07380|nr:hypothetical protein [Amycolatopsis sp. CA-128772]
MFEFLGNVLGPVFAWWGHLVSVVTGGSVLVGVAELLGLVLVVTLLVVFGPAPAGRRRRAGRGSKILENGSGE